MSDPASPSAVSGRHPPGAGLSFRATAITVIVFAIAIAYLEGAVVVYLQAAFSSRVGDIFPLRPSSDVGDLIAIEAGREAATLLIIATVGVLVGRTPLDRLAWGAVVFGAWDIGYYAWLLVFAGWPPSLGTLDLLFLLPVPWVGPVWSPVLVSVALVGVGLVTARTLRSGRPLVVARWHWAAGLAGGILVVLSYTIDAPRVMDGAMPGPYPWPIFATGMALALAAAADVLRHAGREGVGASPRPASAPAGSDRA